MAYSFVSYVVLTVITAFRVRSLAALFLLGAIYGWLVEGVIAQTLYFALPVSISITGLSWHALFTILLGLWLIPSLLRQRKTGRLLLTCLLTGLGYGLWSLSWWVNAPPPTPLPIYAAYTLLTTLGLSLAYWLASKVQMARFAPSRAEIIVLSALWLAYFAFITFLTQFLALIVLLPLLLLVLVGLHRNRAAETRPDLLAEASQQGSITLPNALLLLVIPLTAIGVYAVALAIHFAFPIGIVFYLVTGLIGFIALVVALIRTYRRKAVSGIAERSVVKARV